MTARARQSTRGLTLLELIAATAIFALVSLMALQALTGGLIQRRVIEAADTEQAELARMLALLRQDLEAAIPLSHLSATGGSAPALDLPPAGGFALSRSGLPDLSGLPGGDGLARVVWRVDPGAARLMRQAGPLIDTPGPASPEHAVLDGVTGLRLIARGDWPDAPDGLPDGLEAVVETRRWGTVRVVVAR